MTIRERLEAIRDCGYYECCDTCKRNAVAALEIIADGQHDIDEPAPADPVAAATPTRHQERHMSALFEAADRVRVELVCALHSPDARNREPDLAAAHRDICAVLVGLRAASVLATDEESGT